MNEEQIQAHDTSSAEDCIRAMLPDADPHAFHRVVTVAVLLPADEDQRNAVITKLSPAEYIGGLQILDVRQGFTAIELDVAREQFDDPERFATYSRQLAMIHNLHLIRAGQKADEIRKENRPPPAPLLTPRRSLFSWLAINFLGIAAAFTALSLLSHFFS